MKTNIKRTIIMPFAAAALSIYALSGCGSDSGDGGENFSQTETVTEYVMQEGDTQVTGEVSSIVGNEVTLELGSISENQSESVDIDVPSDEDTENMGEMPSPGDFPDGEERPERGDFPENVDFPQFGEDVQFDENMQSSDREKSGGRGERQSRSSITKNGETSVYIIPVGMQVSGLSGRSSDYSGIAQGDILTITLNSDGEVAAVSVN